MAPDAPRRRLRRVVGSVRFRVTALATLVTTAVLIVGGVVLVGVQRQQLVDNLDDRIRQRADDLVALVAGDQAPETLAGRGDEDLSAEIVTLDGEVVAKSANIRQSRPLVDPTSDRFDRSVHTTDLFLDEEDPFRLLTRRVPSADGPSVIQVAGNLDDVHESTTVLETSLKFAIPSVAVVLAALIWWLVGRTLRPVESIRAEVAAIGGTELHRRVPQPRGEDEIARLARTMNVMLDRVEDATRKQDRFVADASHELRSPLTRIRSALEIDLAHPDRADLTATQRSLLDETVALQRLVDDLLHLARADAGGGVLAHTPVDLDDVVMRQARRLRADGRVEVDITAVSAAQIDGDADQLNRALRNLADNAARHASSRVAFGLSERGDTATLTVSDDGSGIPVEQRERVFERFTRLDDSRTARDGGTGLGLAITRDIIERHGGSIAIDPDYRPGTRFTITLPTRNGRS